MRAPERMARIEKKPVGGLRRPGEMAASAGFLASPEGSYLAGVTMEACGGAVMISLSVLIDPSFHR
jgi:NAD(P)-dependent dehydrogenase (short-subunit alcohol dehydrogenase family)